MPKFNSQVIQLNHGKTYNIRCIQSNKIKHNGDGDMVLLGKPMEKLFQRKNQCGETEANPL